MINTSIEIESNILSDKLFHDILKKQFYSIK